MSATPEARARIMAFNEYDTLRDVDLLKRCLLTFGLVITGFMLAHSLHMEPATIALGGAALLLLLVTFSLDTEQAGHKIHEFFG